MMMSNKFTVDRLPRGDNVATWLMAQSSLARQVGLTTDEQKIQMVHSCFNDTLKYMFQPASSTTMTAYLTFVQDKAHGYKSLLIQKIDNTAQVCRSSSLTLSAIVPTPPHNINPCISNPLSSLHWSQDRPSQPSHMPQPPMNLSQPCCFCQGAHQDHLCQQKPAGFGGCRHCGGPHYATSCPLRPVDDNTTGTASPGKYCLSMPQFNMRIGPAPEKQQPETNNGQLANARAQGFVNVAPPVWACQTCIEQFPSKRALLQHILDHNHLFDQATLQPGAEEPVHSFSGEVQPPVAMVTPPRCHPRTQRLTNLVLKRHFARSFLFLAS